MRKLKKMARTLNDDFRKHLAAAMAVKFDGLKVETSYAFLADRLVTKRVDGEDFTPEQMQYLEAYSEGYGKALSLVRYEDVVASSLAA